jgi:putative tricarboxylic transport membrane protein
MMTDRVIFICTIVIAAIYLYATTLIPSLEIGDPLGPKAFPRLLGIALLISAGLLGLEMWKDRKVAAAPVGPKSRDLSHLWVLAGVTIWTAGYYLVFEKLGYIIATSIYLLGLMFWFSRGRPITNVVTAVLFAALTYLLFVKLDVNLPKGLLPF